jgi:hypothetical protein
MLNRFTKIKNKKMRQDKNKMMQQENLRAKYHYVVIILSSMCILYAHRGVLFF